MSQQVAKRSPDSRSYLSRVAVGTRRRNPAQLPSMRGHEIGFHQWIVGSDAIDNAIDNEVIGDGRLSRENAGSFKL